MTKLLLMLKRAAGFYPKRSAGYPPFQQTRCYAAASTSARRAVGSLSPPAGGLTGRRLFSGDHKFSHEGSQDSKKDKDAVRMTKKFYPTQLAVLAFATICLLLALVQRRNLLESISKDMDEVVQKMEHLGQDQRRNLLESISKDMDEVGQKIEHLTELMRQTDHGSDDE